MPKIMMVTACHREAAAGQKGNVGVETKRVRVADSSPVTARAAQGALQRSCCACRDSAETRQCTLARKPSTVRHMSVGGAWSVKGRLGSRCKSRSRRVQVRVRHRGEQKPDGVRAGGGHVGGKRSVALA